MQIYRSTQEKFHTVSGTDVGQLIESRCLLVKGTVIKFVTGSGRFHVNMSGSQRLSPQTLENGSACLHKCHIHISSAWLERCAATLIHVCHLLPW